MSKIPILISCVFLLLLGHSCQPSDSFEESATLSEYLQNNTSKSIEALHTALESDIAYLDTVLGDAENTQLYFSFGFSAGGNGNDETDFDIAAPLEVRNIKDSIALAFAEDIEDLSMGQDFIHPNSELHVDYPDAVDGGIITADFDTIFFEGKTVPLKAIGLQNVDSAMVTLKYLFPTEIERLELSSDADVASMDKITEIDLFKGNEVEFSMPQLQYQKVLGYQAVTADNRLMDHTASSSFPLTVVRHEVLDRLTRTLDLMKQATDLKSAPETIALLQQIPETVFEDHVMLNQMKADVKTFEDAPVEEMISGIKQLIEDHHQVLAPEKQSISLGFPATVATLYVYIAKEYDSISKRNIAHNSPLEANTFIPYMDSITQKYGLADTKGNVLIAARFKNELLQVDGSNYFNSYPRNSYFLNVDKKELIEIQHKSFVKKMDEERSIFKDSLDYWGVLKNNTEVVLPFQFDNIEPIGNSFAVMKSLRGRARRSILNAKAEPLIENLRDVTVADNENMALVETKDRKMGLIDGDGNYKITPQEYALGFTENNSLLTYTSGRYKGLMTADGQPLTEEKYREIYVDEGNYILVEDGTDFMFKFLQLDGTSAIPGQYEDAFSFIGDRALVAVEDGVWAFIDKQGTIVTKIPESAGDLIDIKGENEETRYVFRKNTYDAQGKALQN